jgi:hypothetical protein
MASSGFTPPFCGWTQQLRRGRAEAVDSQNAEPIELKIV